MPTLLPYILLTEEALSSEDAYEVVLCHVGVVNAAREAFIEVSELHPDAMLAYWLDYYRSQVETGGLALFAYNTRFDAALAEQVARGLGRLGLVDHVAVFNRARALMDRMDEATRTLVLSEVPSPGHGTAAPLAALDDALLEAIESDDLMYRVREFLVDHPDLVVHDADGVEAVLRSATGHIRDLDARKERAREREPEVVKQTRALCAIAALNFQGFLGVEPHEIDGETVPAWHLMASGSRCILTTWEGCTVLINADDQAVLARMDA